MSEPSQSVPPHDPVIQYYDTHPINFDQIMHALAARNVDLTHLTEDILQEHDQDHFGAIGANDILAAKAGIARHHHLLDVCSGMGGPARYYAHHFGCKVTGLDFTESRYRGAIELTRLTRLDHLVDYRLGNALDMPFADRSFDMVVGQEAWCHVPDKPRLVRECVRVLKPGGVIAFTDILRTDLLDEVEGAKVMQGMTFPSLESLAGYGELLRGAGCELVSVDDLDRKSVV